MYSEIKIKFQCEVSQSGYKLTDGEDGKRWIVARNANAPLQPANMKFKMETLTRFLKVSEDKKHEEDLALDFTKTYGLLAPARSYRVQDISGWSTYLRLKNIERAKGEPVELWHLMDFNKFISFEAWEDDKVLPTFKPDSLGTALYLMWVFFYQTPDNLKKCQHFAEYGQRTGCSHFFVSSNRKKIFCQDSCRTTYADRKKKAKDRS